GVELLLEHLQEIRRSYRRGDGYTKGVGIPFLDGDSRACSDDGHLHLPGHWLHSRKPGRRRRAQHGEHAGIVRRFPEPGNGLFPGVGHVPHRQLNGVFVATGIREPTSIVDVFGGQLHTMDRPGAIGAGLASEGVDLKKMHDAVLGPERGVMAGQEQRYQYDAKDEHEPLHISLLCRYGASTALPGICPGSAFTGCPGARRAQESVWVGSAVPGVTTT